MNSDSVVCPTVTAYDAHQFRTQIDRIASFTERIHIDLIDGDFASPTSVSPVQIWWPENIHIDLHMMFRNPISVIETLVSLQPNMVIIHAESERAIEAIDHLNACKIMTGLAILPETSVESVEHMIRKVSHVLVFGGHLGSFGGVANLEMLEKIPQIKAINSECEIGWDGGANEDNAAQLSRSGVNVINFGSAIQLADNPESAYDTLVEKVTEQ